MDETPPWRTAPDLPSLQSGPGSVSGVPTWILVLLLLASLAAIAVVAWARRRDTGSRPVRTRAWDLTEGTELPGEIVILQVDREPLLGSVRVVTDQPSGAAAEYRADDLVEVVRLVR